MRRPSKPLLMAMATYLLSLPPPGSFAYHHLFCRGYFREVYWKLIPRSYA